MLIMSQISNRFNQGCTKAEPLDNITTTRSDSNNQSVVSGESTGVAARSMGGIVSRLNAVLFGGKSKEDRFNLFGRTTSQNSNHVDDRNKKPNQENVETAINVTCTDSNTGYERMTSKNLASTLNGSKQLEHSSENYQLVNEIESENDSEIEEDYTADADEDEESMSELECSELEEPDEEEEADVSEEHLERIDSDDEEQGSHLEEESNSDWEAELEDRCSRAGSDEEHICDSDCDHSQDDELYEQEEEELSIDGEHSEEDNELVEISDNEQSENEYEEYEEDESAEEEEASEGEGCGEDCLSDCDGYHHECSSECECTFHHSDQEADPHPQRLATEETNDTIRGQRHHSHNSINHIHGSLTTDMPANSLGGLHNDNISSISVSELLNQSKHLKQTNLESREKNNNKVKSSSSVDMTELRSAIDARVRRSASQKEVPTHIRANSNSTDSTLGHVNSKDNEMRRRQRRARLRTLELKREQILDEVRDGTKDRVIDAMYTADIITAS